MPTLIRGPFLLLALHRLVKGCKKLKTAMQSEKMFKQLSAIKIDFQFQMNWKLASEIDV